MKTKKQKRKRKERKLLNVMKRINKLNTKMINKNN